MALEADTWGQIEEAREGYERYGHCSPVSSPLSVPNPYTGLGHLDLDVAQGFGACGQPGNQLNARDPQPRAGSTYMHPAHGHIHLSHALR